MACTVPWPLNVWMNKNHPDICKEHDDAYVKRIWSIKVASDFVVSQRFAERGYYSIAYVAVHYLAVFGTIYWLWKKYRVAFTK